MRSEEVADSTDSTLIIDKIAPVHEEVQKTSFARNIHTLIGRGKCDFTFSRPFSLSWIGLIEPHVRSPSPPARSIAAGTTAVTDPPCCRTEPEMMPIMPLEPPPYTSGRESKARARPKAVEAEGRKNGGRGEGESVEISWSARGGTVSNRSLRAGTRARCRD